MSERTLSIIKNPIAVAPLVGKKLTRALISETDNDIYDLSNSHLQHNFSNLNVYSNKSFNQSCPFSISNPSRCPFGGACHMCSVKVQAKLKISQPNDKYEQEADRIAEQVMHMPEPTVQQKPLGEEDDLLQTKPLAKKISSISSPNIQKLKRQELDVDEEEREEKEGEEEIILAKELPGRAPRLTPQVNSNLRNMGSGQPLPENVRISFESRFGYNFNQVRVHTDSKARETAQALNAQAFTIGSNIVFGTGQYAPESVNGNKLLAHELTHVVQQDGRQLKQVRRYEKDRLATSPHKFTRINIQSNTVQGYIQRRIRKDTDVPCYIYVNRPMSLDEFKIEAMNQLFGKVLKNINWWGNLPNLYVPEKSPYTLWVDIHLFKQLRSQAIKERGFSVQEEGITGAKERAKTFHAGSESDEKSALMKEIDRRYFEAIGDKRGTRIKTGEKGKAEIWRMIRDEVLFQHEYIANLPSSVKKLIKHSIKGKELTPADYDKLFDIAKKIEKMPDAQANDYANKVTATTKDLDVFEASLDNYITEMAERSKQAQEHERIHTKLYGLKELYLKLRSLESWERVADAPMGTSQRDVQITAKEFAKSEIRKLRPELENQLKRYKFSGLSEFKAYIKKFEIGFRQEAANIAKDILKKYAGMLYRESERYKDRTEVQALHDQLGGVRTEYMVQQKHQKEVDRLHMQRWMGAHQTYVPPKSQEQKYHEAEVARHKESVNLEVVKLAKTNPIFNEEQLPSDKQIDKGKLATADVDGLQALLLKHIADRIKHTQEAIAEIDHEPEQIYKMVKLMPFFFAQLGIRPDSIHEAIIKDKLSEGKILKLIKGIAIALVSIALVVLTAGAATPFVAAGAAIASAGLGGYMAYHDYQEYVKEKKLAAVGFVDDPSAAWLVISVVGAALDMAAAAKALKAIGESADAVRALRALEQSSDLKSLNDFSKALKALEEESKISAKVRVAAEKAAEARKGFAEATKELTFAIGSKAYSFPGPLTDPDVYKALVKMARQAIKTKIYDIQKFIEELKLAKIRAGLGNLTPEELANAKKAWEEGNVLEAASESKSVTQVGEIIATPPFQRGFIRFQLVGNERDVELLKAAKEGANVYVFKNAQGQVIYVGYTERTTFTRLGEHLATDKPGEFLGEVSYIEIRGKGLLEREARALEEDLIQELKPKWNKELTPYQNKYGTPPHPDDVKEANNTLIRLEIRFAE